MGSRIARNNMGRKKFIKWYMASRGVDKRAAEYMARCANECGISYKTAHQRLMRWM